MSETNAHKPLHEAFFHISLAAPDDAELMCSIRDEAWIETYPSEALGLTADDIRVNAQGLHGEFVPRRIEWLKNKLSVHDDNWIAFTGKFDDTVRGFVIASKDNSGRDYINSLYVKPGYQGKGLGKKLLTQALAWLGDQNNIYLEVAAHNDNAIRFYKQFGFVKTDNIVEEEPDRPGYIKPVPQIEMVLIQHSS